MMLNRLASIKNWFSRGSQSHSIIASDIEAQDPLPSPPAIQNYGAITSSGSYSVITTQLSSNFESQDEFNDEAFQIMSKKNGIMRTGDKKPNIYTAYTSIADDIGFVEEDEFADLRLVEINQKKPAYQLARIPIPNAEKPTLTYEQIQETHSKPDQDKRGELVKKLLNEQIALLESKHVKQEGLFFPPLGIVLTLSVATLGNYAYAINKYFPARALFHAAKNQLDGFNRLWKETFFDGSGINAYSNPYEYFNNNNNDDGGGYSGWGDVVEDANTLKDKVMESCSEAFHDWTYVGGGLHESSLLDCKMITTNLYDAPAFYSACMPIYESYCNYLHGDYKSVLSVYEGDFVAMTAIAIGGLLGACGFFAIHLVRKQIKDERPIEKVLNAEELAALKKLYYLIGFGYEFEDGYPDLYRAKFRIENPVRDETTVDASDLVATDEADIDEVALTQEARERFEGPPIKTLQSELNFLKRVAKGPYFSEREVSKRMARHAFLSGRLLATNNLDDHIDPSAMRFFKTHNNANKSSLTRKILEEADLMPDFGMMRRNQLRT